MRFCLNLPHNTCVVDADETWKLKKRIFSGVEQVLHLPFYTPLTMFDFCFHPWNSRTTFIPPCFDIHKEIWNLRNAKIIMYSHCKYVLMRLQADSKGSGFKHANSGYWQWSKKFTLLLYWKVLFIGNSSSDMKENFKVVRHEKEFRIRIASLSSSK